ncbi:MAG: class I SAM-dependent methyltransferase [Oscillospiraceae bacterium]
MDFNELRKIDNELEQISSTYEIFNEDSRLNYSNSARVEFLTTIKYIEQYLKPTDKILDIGAGAGEYSLYFAKNGYDVNAVELADNNIKAFREKITDDSPVLLTQGNAMDLSIYEDNSFDIVLLFGPLYHLHNEIDRQKCISEAKRVCKDNGVLFFAFISHDMVIATELANNSNFFNNSQYDHETLRLEDFPFVFFTVNECRKMLMDGNITIDKEIASDGMSELLAEKINALDDYSYKQYLKYHFYCCEKPELLGHSNHLLFIGTK